MQPSDDDTCTGTLPSVMFSPLVSKGKRHASTAQYAARLRVKVKDDPTLRMMPIVMWKKGYEGRKMVRFRKSSRSMVCFFIFLVYLIFYLFLVF